MALKSNFKADLKKEKQLHKLLDNYYDSKLKQYHFKRIHDINLQHKGVDVIFTHKQTNKEYYIDEKAQLDYINESLPTFAFELSYLKNNILKNGWLFDDKKKTNFYALITSIFSDEKNKFTQCKITIVNRTKLIALLESKGLTKESLTQAFTQNKHSNAKIKIEELNPNKEGYLFHSAKNKNEQPLNLILKLDWLVYNGVGKNL